MIGERRSARFFVPGGFSCLPGWPVFFLPSATQESSTTNEHAKEE
jgi:hypothetical protein